MEWGRTDKKSQVAPYIPNWQRELVHDIGRHIHLGSNGEAGRQIVITAARDIPTLNRLSTYFWRDYHHRETSWIGHLDHANLDELVSWPFETTERFKMRFVRDDWTMLHDLSFALARPIAHTAAALLTLGLRDKRVIERIAPGFVARSPFTLRKGFYQWGSGRT